VVAVESSSGYYRDPFALMLWSRCLLPILVVAVTHDYSGGVCVGEEAHVCHNYGVASSTTRLVSQAEEPVSTCLGPNFRVQWEPSSFHLRVSPCASNRSDGTSKNKTIWETVGRAPFLVAGLGEFEMEEVGMGSFRSKKDNPGRLTVFQTVDHVSYNATALILRGRLSFLHPRRASRGKIDGTKEDGGTGKDASKVGRYSNDEADGEEAVNDNDESAKMNGEIDYILSLSWDEEVSLEHHLSINVEMEGVDGLASGKISHAVLRYASDREESFFGLGEQFSHWNMKGRRLPIYVQEQGIGRGLQPLSFLAEFVETGASGEWHSSYSTIPHYITNKHRSLYLKGYLYSVFDFTKPDSVEITIARAPREGRGALKIAAGVVTGNTMKEHVARYTQYAGRMRQLPDWTVCGGAVLGLEGGTDAVLHAYRAMRGAGTPIAALWIQDWSGFVKDDFGTRVNWNWRLDKEHYPGWEEMVHQIREATGTRVLTYVNPYLSNKQSKDGNSAENNLFQQAAKLGFLVRNSSGEPYIQRCASRTFTFGTIDLANPKAVAWFKEEVLERGMIEGSKASGWMADFGEYLPYDSRIGGRVHGQGYSEEEDPEHFHNRFPEEWAKLNAEVVADRSSSGSNGTGTDEGEIVFFCRAISTRSPRHATLFWTGDQMVTWDRHDGLHSALLGVLSGGLSGVALTHSDIGGYTMVERCVLGGAICMYITRDCELLMRWAEMSAFTGTRPIQASGRLVVVATDVFIALS